MKVLATAAAVACLLAGCVSKPDPWTPFRDTGEPDLTRTEEIAGADVGAELLDAETEATAPDLFVPDEQKFEICAPECISENPCTDAYCEAGECVHQPVDGSCDDGDPCTEGDTCEAGECKPGSDQFECDDFNSCTDNLCIAGVGCQYDPNAADCDDEDPCTVGDKCEGGECKAGPDPLACDDGNDCTFNSCAAGEGCKYEPKDQAACDDGFTCTNKDTCQGKVCVGEQVSCNDNNPCTVDTCDPTVGCVFEPATGAECDDGNECTKQDACIGPMCIGPQFADWILECKEDACGNGICQGDNSATNCPTDCGPCGDGVCGHHEVVEGVAGGLCPMDCLPPCGDGECEAGELEGCPVDCGGCPDG